MAVSILPQRSWTIWASGGTRGPAAPPLAKPLDESHNMPISRLSPLRVFAWLDLYIRRLNITVHRLIFCMGTRYAEYHAAPDPTLPRCDIPALIAP